jgi:O-antigen ligase
MALLKVTASLLVVVWVFYAASTKRIRWKSSVVSVPLSLFVLAIILSSVFSVAPLNSLLSSWGERFEEVPTWLSYIVIFLAALSFHGKPKKTENILKALVAGSVVASFHGIFQRFGYDLIRLGWADQMRSSAFLGNPIVLGGYMAMVIPIALGLALASKFSEEKVLWGVAGGLASLTLVFTLSRGAWIGAAAGVLVFGLILLKEREYRRRALILMLVVVTAVSLGYLLSSAIKLGPSVLTRISEPSTSEGSLATRLSIWRTSLRMIAERPGQPWGFENFRNYFSNYREEIHVRLTQGRVLPDRPHNQLIYIAFATGALGLLSYLWLIVVFLWQAIRRIKENGSVSNKKMVPLLAGLMAATAAYLVQEQFSSSLPAITPLFWMLAGLLISPSLAADEHNRNRYGYKVRRTVLAVLAGTILAIVLLVSTGLITYADFNYYQGLKVSIAGESPLRAEKWFEKAIRLNPLKGEYRLALGRMYRRFAYETENPVWVEKAVEVYRAGIKYDPASPNLYFGLGEAYYAYSFLRNESDYTLAKQYLIQGLLRLPYSEDGRVLLAETLIQEGNLDEAFRQISLVLGYSPSDFRALYTMGILLERRDDLSSAASYFQRALEINPGSIEVREKLRGLASKLR